MKLNETDRKALESLSSIGCEVCFSAGGEASSTSHCHSISARYYKEAHEFGDCVIAGFQRVLKGMSALEVPELCFENEGTLKLTDSSNTGVELCVEGICLDKEEQPVLPEIHPSAIRFLVNASVVERIKLYGTTFNLNLLSMNASGGTLEIELTSADGRSDSCYREALLLEQEADFHTILDATAFAKLVQGVDYTARLDMDSGVLQLDGLLAEGAEITYSVCLLDEQVFS